MMERMFPFAGFRRNFGQLIEITHSLLFYSIELFSIRSSREKSAELWAVFYLLFKFRADLPHITFRAIFPG